jgi:DNA-binding CsgD family transcriptional regulator
MPVPQIRLAPREREIVHLTARGLAPKEIAAALAISTRCVNSRISGICQKLGVGCRPEIVVWLLQHPAGLDGPLDPGLHPPGCHCDAPYCRAMFRRSYAHPLGCRCSSDLCRTHLKAA